MPEAAVIPIIDISTSSRDRAQTARALVDAAVDHGFVYIRHSGLPLTPKQVDGAFDLSRKLFASPLEDKTRCKIQKNNQGWSGMHTETLDPKNQRVGDFKEGFNFGSFAGERATQPLPQSIEPYQSQLFEFREACHELCREILMLFGIGLNITPPEYFTAAHTSDKASGSILRFLYYPAPSSPTSADAVSRLPTDVRAGAHSDYGSVTLLFRLRGQAGLEILERTGTWSPVPVTPPGTENDPSPPILVNIGDLLSYWTNGLLRSTVHRVTFSPTDGPETRQSKTPEDANDSARYSIVFFCHPADETPLSAVPSERVRKYGQEYGAVDMRGRQQIGADEHSDPAKVLTADEHLQMRLRATYLQMYSEDDK